MGRLGLGVSSSVTLASLSPLFLAWLGVMMAREFRYFVLKRTMLISQAKLKMSFKKK